MILTTLSGFTAYRMDVPKRAVVPTSGAGAGRHGGRVNRIGLNALYLALDVNTAVQEYQQVSPLMPPGTLVSYQLTVNPPSTSRGGPNATWGQGSGRISAVTGVAAGSISASSRPVG